MTTTLVTTAHTSITANSTIENNYASLFVTYINQSLTEALATVRAVETRLPDEERVQACHVLDFGLRTTTAWLQARDLAIALAPYVERSGDWETWQQQLHYAIALADQVQDIEGKIGLMVFVARLAQRQGRLAETIYYYRRVIPLARQTGNRFQEARACSNLGYLFTETGRFLRAEVLCQHALVIFTDLQSNHGMAHTHNHLGLLYTRQRRYASAEEHLQLACELWQCIQDVHSLFHGNVNLGMLCVEMDRSHEALQYLDLALEIAEKSGETIGIARVWNNKGLVYLKLRNFNLAEQYFGKAHSLFSQISDDGELAKIHHNLGLTYQYLEKWPDALYHLEIALRLFQAIQNTVEEMKVLVALVAHNRDSAYVSAYEKYGKALDMLVAQKNDSEFQSVFHDYIMQYYSNFPDSLPRKLLQLVAT